MGGFLTLLLTALCAAAQTTPGNRLTFSGGWSRETGGFSFRKQTAPGLGISYGCRVRRYLEPEAGVFTALNPTGEVCGRSGCVDIRDRFFWIPFGVRFIAPPYLDRIEFSGGGGGLYEKYTVGSPFPGGGYLPRRGWGGYFTVSAAFALDRSRHWWFGFSPRLFLANPAFARDRWVQLNGEVSYRFR